MRHCLHIHASLRICIGRVKSFATHHRTPIVCQMPRGGVGSDPESVIRAFSLRSDVFQMNANLEIKNGLGVGDVHGLVGKLLTRRVRMVDRWRLNMKSGPQSNCGPL